ncbi:MAG TPA: ATP-binding protein [Xanthobacteraceae bacterium]|nr:ATP-binding protein [Xanthobacteraceae bacterium]
MNAASNDTSPAGAPLTAPHARRVRGWWFAAPVMFAIILLAAFGWLASYIALPALAVLATLMAVEIRSASRGMIIDAAPRLVPAAADPTAALAALVNALPEPALLVDRASTVIAGNVPAAAAFGRIRSGEPISFTVRNPQILEAIRAAAGGQTQRFEINERFPVERALEAHVAPVIFAHELPEFFLLSFRDLTQERRLAQMRTDFVANASHELRTPLASLLGFIDTLRGSARDDTKARERFLKIMAEQARRMSRLIDDLMSLSRIELSLHLLPQSRVDLAGVVAQVCDTLAPLAEERGVTLKLKREAAEAFVLGDRDELIRVFENLVENALKYGASGKRVDVTLSAAAGEAAVSVRDFGPGIAPEHLPRLTERFYRVDVEKSRGQGGTGLGLALVKHILARHRGTLSIDSELGKGAIFTARIPLDDSGIHKKEVDAVT